MEIRQQKAGSFKIMGGLGILTRMCVFILQLILMSHSQVMFVKEKSHTRYVYRAYLKIAV